MADFSRSRDSLPTRVEQRIQGQRDVAQRLKDAALPTAAKPLPFITVSRQCGCEAVLLSEQLAERLNATETAHGQPWQIYSRGIIEELARDVDLSPGMLEALDRSARGGMQEFFETMIGRSSSDITVMRHLISIVRAVALLGHSIIVGRGGAILTQDMPGGIHLRLVAPDEWRQQNLVSRFGWDAAKAAEVMHEEEQHRKSFVEKYLGRDISRIDDYDLILNVARMSREEQTETILGLYHRRFKPDGTAARQ